MFFSLLGGSPKPEPEQVIRNYTEELKTAPEEVCVTGPALLLLLFGNGVAQMRPLACPLPEGASSIDQSCPPGCGEGQPGFLLLTPSRLHLTRLC